LDRESLGDSGLARMLILFPSGSILDPYEGFILGLIASRKDITLVEISERLMEEHGVRAVAATIWCFFDERGLTFKENSSRERTGPGRREGAAARLVFIDGHSRRIRNGQGEESPTACAQPARIPGSIADDALVFGTPFPGMNRQINGQTLDRARCTPAVYSEPAGAPSGRRLTCNALILWCCLRDLNT
jgi:hypothetical protein